MGLLGLSDKVIQGTLTANKFMVPGGLTAQFLMANGDIKTFGTLAGTVAQGNDSRINNGQTAHGWGNHAGLYDNYSSWNLKTNGVQRTGMASGAFLDIVAGNNMSVSYGAGGVVTLAATNTNTWIANSQANAGYIAAGGTNYNMVWATDGAGNPGWGSIPATAGATSNHIQAVAATTWTFTHNLGFQYPAITVYDTLNNVILPETVTATSTTVTTIVFSTAITGRAVAVVGGTGAQGIPGDTPTLAVGTVTTGAAGSSVIITDGGTALARTFNFTIPQGAAGADGIQLTNLSSTAVGLTYTNTTGVFSATAGYTIPTTAKQTNWDTAFGWGNHANTYLPLAGGTLTGALSGTSATFSSSVTTQSADGFKLTNGSSWNINTDASNLYFSETNVASWLIIAKTTGAATFASTVTATGFLGNATTATTLTSTQSNWASTGVANNVVGMLAWRNYSNSHVIFGASAGTSPSGTAISNTNAEIAWYPTIPTLMGWNGSSTYGVRVDSARLADSASSVPWSNITSTPTTLAGYGITDASGAGLTVSVISTNTPAVKNYLYVFTATLTLTLPITPAIGDRVGISNRSGVLTCVIARNGSNIAGLAEDMTVDALNIGFELVYTDATQGWVLQ